ncbi:MAG TPA: sialate O-acetylesterase [Puia sp.]|nr:sialate O-acetylesterase [Puia sp.]
MLNQKSAAFSALFWLCIGSTFGQVRLPRLVSDSMVLQRNIPATIWGWAAPAEKVTVKFKERSYHAIAGKDARWSVKLLPLDAGGPYDMEIDGSNHIVLRNILVGDIWICSGQSNMELPMERVKEKYPEQIAHAANPSIRQFVVATRYDFSLPDDDLASGNWQAATPASVLSFSAAGYFFANDLFQKYHVPIGLIKASAGGAPVEAWLDESTLKAFPAYLELAYRFRNGAYRDSIKRSDDSISSRWYLNIWRKDSGLHAARLWYDPTYDDAAWPEMSIPGFWDTAGLKGTNGVVWFRKEIDVPVEMAGRPAKLFLGRIIDRDSVFVNGIFAGTIGYQYPPRRYDLPPGLLRPGKNTIAIRVINSSGKGGFVPDKTYRLTAGDDRIDLRGRWRYKLGVSSDPLPGNTFFQYQPLGLFNGIIAPLLPLAIKGVIWYQGESNTGKPREYRRLFSAMITNWRERWGQGNFPFLFVQLANYGEAKEQPGESEWAALRQAQLETLAVPNTAMAVALDIGEWNDLHPLNKEDVGKRLALAAQKIAYGDQTVVGSGPVYQSAQISGNKIRIGFTNMGGGLINKGGEPLRQFAIAGADHKFVWARAEIEGDKVIVWSEEVAHPVAVRYAWADNPEGANLYNKEGLPASPFESKE